MRGCYASRVRYMNSHLSMSVLAAVFALVTTGWSTTMAQQIVYIASPAGEGGGGIFIARLDADTGALSNPEKVATEPGSFLALHPNGKTLYSVGGTRGKPHGVVRAYSIDSASRKLTLLNEQSSGGGGPCHLAVDPSGKCLIAVNYGEGNFSALPIDADGRLRPATATVQHEGKGPNPSRQGEPHPHSVNFSSDGKIALIADLGIDRIKLYDVDAAAATVKPHDPADAPAPPGAGPRHMAFSPDGKFAYVSGEMTSTVIAYAWDGKRGALTEIQSVSSIPDDYAEADKNTTSEIAVHPSGKCVYVANRGHDSIAAFEVAGDGKLSFKWIVPTLGKVPRHFAVDPSGKWMLIANQGSDNVTIFGLDPASGQFGLPVEPALDLKQPMCVLFLRER